MLQKPSYQRLWVGRFENQLSRSVYFMQKSEMHIQTEIRLALSEIAIVFRANVGKVRMADGRFFDTGLPKGFSDLFGLRKADGKLFFLEIKNRKGKLRDDQVKFLTAMSQYDVITGVARSVEDAMQIIQTGSKFTDTL